jgi:hypothetical protein
MYYMSCDPQHFVAKEPEIPAELKDWCPVWQTGRLPVTNTESYSMKRFLARNSDGLYGVVYERDGVPLMAWICTEFKDIIEWTELPYIERAPQP